MRHSVPSEHEIACTILHAVRRRDWSLYAHAIVQSDALQQSVSTTLDFQKTLNALQTATVEEMTKIDHLGRVTERYKTRFLPLLRRIARDNELSFSDDAPVRSLILQLHLDRWPPLDKDARIIDALSQAYDAMIVESSHAAFDQ